MGGFVAAELAISFPQRVERLVLVSAAGITAEHLPADRVMAGARAVACTADRSVSRHRRVRAPARPAAASRWASSCATPSGCRRRSRSS